MLPCFSFNDLHYLFRISIITVLLKECTRKDERNKHEKKVDSNFSFENISRALRSLSEMTPTPVFHSDENIDMKHRHMVRMFMYSCSSNLADSFNIIFK
jgi:hypothetical protein